MRHAIVVVFSELQLHVLSGCGLVHLEIGGMLLKLSDVELQTLKLLSCISTSEDIRGC